ncbi:hypothetical protein [Modestobacter sp. Leaf380]|uniref:hypothetical protein n=1 Tax=Modestobacter sp. Leaf380 TaxID=1736356 RepID=UPI0006F8A16B|nr:hypothetical protein [Modestobacter sp. Leaf380]KQS68403.1 hypothetical protein ASG41_05270 [Modestobacter sp. Leaf380]
MPSRSPEPPSGATRDEAIAAAREEFGPDVRIRGVRRIRSGGVAGFFSSERYVADVVDPAGTPGPGEPTPVTPGRPVAVPAGSLSSAEALAAWPTSGLSVDDLLAVAQEVSRAQQSAARTAVPAVDPAVDPVDELADLLGAAGPTDVDVYSPTSLARPAAAAAPRVPAAARAAAVRAAAPAPAAPTAVPTAESVARPVERAARPLTQRRAEEPVGPQAPAWERTSRSAPAAAAVPPEPSVPDEDDDAPVSPFTAALMRMVTQDDEVQSAVAGATELAARDDADEQQRVAVEELTRALAQERAARRAAAPSAEVLPEDGQDLSGDDRYEADLHDDVEDDSQDDVEDEVEDEVEDPAVTERELRQAAVLASERRAAARLRAQQEAHETAVARAAEVAARSAATARRAAAREAEVAALARVELARAEAEAWELQAQRENARVRAARVEAARVETARVEALRVEAERVAAEQEAAELQEAARLDAVQAAEHAAAAGRAEAARAVAAHETARFEAPSLRAVPHRDPRRAGPPPVDRAATQRAQALRAAGRRAEQQATAQPVATDGTDVTADRAARLRSVLAALPAAPTAVPAPRVPASRVQTPPVSRATAPETDAARTGRIPAVTPGPARGRVARPLPVAVPVPVAVVTTLPPVHPAPAPTTAPQAAVPTDEPAAPPVLRSTQSSPREEAQQVSMDQHVVASSALQDAGVQTPRRRGLPDVPPQAGGRASRRAADRRAAEEAVAGAIEAEEIPAAPSAGDDLWGAPTPTPAPASDPSGRHRTARSGHATLEAPADPVADVVVPEAPAVDEQLEALRAAALSGTGSTPRRRRADASGRHRTAGTGLQSAVRPGPLEAEGTLVAVVGSSEPLHTPDHASGFIEVITAVADSDFLGDAPSRPELASEVSGLLVEEMAQEMAAGMADELARTASDPAPLPMDSTTVLPPLSSLLTTPAAAPRVRGPRPPVPPARGAGRSRTAPPHPTTRGRSAAADGLATVTQLLPAAPDAAAVVDPAPAGLTALGLPTALLGEDFGADAAARGTFAALTAVLARTLPDAPTAPAEPGDVLVVVGPGADALGAARVLATSLRLDPARVQWATRGELSGLSTPDVGVPTAAVAATRREAAAGAGVPTVVAVDVPLRDAGSAWVAQMLQAWAPTAVWGVLDATRKPADLTGWLAGLPRVDAVVVTDTESSADPAALLAGLPVPVAVVDGARATAHRWAALLCERLAGRP